MDENAIRGERARRASTEDGERETSPRSGRRSPIPGWRVTPAPDGRGTPDPADQGPRRSNFRWGLIAAVIGLLALNLWISSQALQQSGRVAIPFFPTFLSEVKANNVRDVSATGASIDGTLKHAIRYPAHAKQSALTTIFSTQIPSFVPDWQIFPLLEKHNVTTDAQPPSTGPSFLAELILGFGPTLLLVLLFVFLMRRAASAAGAGGGLMSFGRSRARRVEASDQPITFADVAGIDEAKEELTEIVDFLKNPQKYIRLGGKIPRGVLLSGAPGTGKTLLARAVAGEAEVPFFQMSASEFVEMIVGSAPHGS